MVMYMEVNQPTGNAMALDQNTKAVISEPFVELTMLKP